MTSTTFFLVFIPILAIILLAVNLIFAPHSPYEEKSSAFECGFHSFQQTRSPFNISFFIFALLFLLFDLEILLIYPYVVSSYTNGSYGLIIMLIFFVMLTLGFVFELGKGALKIDSRQNISVNNKNITKTILYTNNPIKNRSGYNCYIILIYLIFIFALALTFFINLFYKLIKKVRRRAYIFFVIL